MLAQSGMKLWNSRHLATGTLIIGVLPFVSMACERKGSGAGPSATPTSRVEPLEIPDGPWQPGERLLAAGAKPQAALRCTPVQGSEQRLRLTQYSRFVAAVDGETVSAQAEPDVLWAIRANVESIAPDETITVGTVIDGVQYLPARDTTEEWWTVKERDYSGLTGTSAMIVLSDRAKVVSQSIDEAVDDEALHARAFIVLTALSPVPLPQEPIGVGAVWETHVEIEVQDTSTRVRRRYRLDSLDGSIARISVTQRHSGQPGLQRIGDHDTELLQRDLHLAGEALIDLTRALPVSIRMKGESRMRVRVHGSESAWETQNSSALGFELDQVQE